MSDDDARNQLVKQNYNLASVAVNKYKYLKHSLRATAFATALAVAGGILYFL